MKWKNFYSIILAVMVFVPFAAQAQSDTEVEKKVIVVKKTIDADGNEKVEKIIKSGDEAEDVLIEEDVKVEVEEVNGQKIVRVTKGDGKTEEIIINEVKSDDHPMRVKIIKDGDEINWEGKGLDEDIRKELEDLDFDMDFDFESFDVGSVIMIDDEESDRPGYGRSYRKCGRKWRLG